MNIHHKRAVGVFSHYSDTERALNALRNSGFDMNNVSLIAKDKEQYLSRDNPLAHETAEGNKSDEAAVAGAATGGIVGTITGLLVGLGTLAIPGVGPILLAGATATAVATTLAGTAIGAAAGGLIGGLVGLGIPEEHAKLYNDRIASGYFLVIVTGDQLSISQAERILREHNIEEWNVYDAPAQRATTSHPTTDAPAQRATTSHPTTDVNPPVTNTDYTSEVNEKPQVIIVDKRNQTQR